MSDPRKIIQSFASRIANGLCGDCGAPRVTACSCRACWHAHYCSAGSCYCPPPAVQAEQARRAKGRAK